MRFADFPDYPVKYDFAGLLAYWVEGRYVKLTSNDWVLCVLACERTGDGTRGGN